MGFKENLLRKIEIDTLAAKVARSVMSPADAAKFDKAATRQLLEMGEFPHVEIKDRGLELYILEKGAEKDKLIVLDNGLAIYHTSVEDVALRKSPSVKEMISIRNAMKILNDGDVRVSKREDSVQTVRQMLTSRLDLNYEASDIAGIADDGTASLENKYAEGVLESLTLFSVLLGFKKAPKIFQASHCDIRGNLEKGTAGETMFGPAYIYDNMHDALKFIPSKIDSRDKDELDRYQRILKDKGSVDAEGAEVFRRLQQLVMDRKPDLKP
jgi:hypothetical protein